MASLSLPASSSPFDSLPLPGSPRSHGRKPSRNVNAPLLPTFTFNPGAQDQPVNEVSSELQEKHEETMEFSDASKHSFRPPPLPEFKFNPGASLPSGPKVPTPSHPILEEMVQNQKRVTRSARPAPLPAFTFSPYSAKTAERSPSPTKATFDDESQSIMSSVGHRRAESELVGAGMDGFQVVSASPRRPEHRSQGPPTGMPRGHIHRRSQAISVTDIDTSELIKANAIAKARAGSVPTTPSDLVQPPYDKISGRSSPEEHSTPYMTRSPPASPRRRGSLPGGRPRVGFSDHVDFIPRPLSMISSETETSTSTVRGSHSLSGSIASIASPTPRLTLNTSSPVLSDDPPKRPQTAEPAQLLANTTTRAGQALTILNLPKRPLSAAGSPSVTSTGSPPTKKKLFWFHSNDPSPSATPTAEQAEQTDPFLDVVVNPAPVVPAPQRKEPTPKRSSSAKKHKYHTWTAGIFSRKRLAKRPLKRTPTPPKMNRQNSDELNEIFDADDTIVIRSDSPEVKRGKPLALNIPPVPASSILSENTITSPVLDLDAALGPFGSEQRLGADYFARNGTSRMAKLHSSERRGTTDAFGVHRRTESAPSMPVPSRSLFDLHHLGSKTSLAGDVFDEEEEDMFLADEKKDGSDTSRPVLPHQNMDSTESGLTQDEGPQLPVTPEPRPMEGLGLPIADGPSDNVIIVDDEDSSPDVRSSKSTIEAPILPEADILKHPVSSPMSFAYPAPRSTYESSTDGRTTSASMVSSPEAEHIWDITPRPGRFLGNPSSEFVIRASNDDLPSLTDSISTSAKPRMSSSGNTRSSIEHRSQSVFVPRVTRPNPAAKRNSIASLSRLLSSSNGSKHKLESPASFTKDEKSKKKTNRISKLMHFWRSKEKDAEA